MTSIKRIKPRNKIRTMILSSVLIVISLAALKYLLPLIELAFLIIYSSVEDGWIYNPSERNYLVFDNESIERVVDSINEFHDLLKEMDIPEPPNNPNIIYFDYSNGELKINKRNAGDFNFEDIRRDPSMIYASDEQVKRFIALFNFLLDNYIDPISFKVSTQELTLDYKNIYKMYPNNKGGVEIEDFRLIEVLPSSSLVDDYYMVLDSYKNIYLIAYKQKKLNSDDTKYIRNER